MKMDPRKLLFTGSSGYIGGSVLACLLTSEKPEIKELKISVLVRKQEQAEVLLGKGVHPILFEGLDDDSKGLTQAASEHDVIIHCASGFHTKAAESLLRGLALNRGDRRHEPIFIHTSGTSNLATRGITQQTVKSRSFSDRDDDVYEYEKQRNATDQYEQRATDIKVIELGEELGVKTFIVMPSCVYGQGTGFFHQQSHQIPMLARNAINIGLSEYVGDGSYRLGHVHVVDLASFFHLILSLILKGSELPYGRRGIYFATTGRHSWLEVATGLGQAGARLGALQSSKPRSVTLEDVAARLFNDNVRRAELTLAANSKTTPDLARSIGWEPKYSETDWLQDLENIFQQCYDESRKNAQREI